MTKLLDKAFLKASELSEIEQNIFARFIIDEIESEKKWEKQFSNSEDFLAMMADSALDEFCHGKCDTLDIAKL